MSGLNLHAIVADAIQPVNPFANGSVRFSTGAYTRTADAKRIPVYAQADDVPMQIQPLTPRDLKFLDGLNIQGTEFAVFVNGSLLGVQRFGQRGGDMLTFDGKVWKTTAVIETWRTGWCKVGVTLQMDTPWGPIPPNDITFNGETVTYDGEPITYVGA